MIKLTKGINMSNNHHHGLPAIFNNTIVLYIGIRQAQPGSPALVNIFQKLAISKIISTSIMSGAIKPADSSIWCTSKG